MGQCGLVASLRSGKVGTTSGHPQLPAASTSSVTSHFAPTLSQFCPQVLLPAHSHNALRALKESFGSMTLSQMSEVKGQSEQTVHAPSVYRKKPGAETESSLVPIQNHFHVTAKCHLADLHAWGLLITTERFYLTSRHRCFYSNASK